MEIVASILSREILSNSVGDLALAIGLFVGAMIVFAIIRRFFLARLEHMAQKTSVKFDDALVRILRGIGVLFTFVLALYLSIQHLTLPDGVQTAVHAVFLFLIVNEMIKIVDRGIRFGVEQQIERSGDGKNDKKKMSSAASLIVKVGLWTLGIVLILSNLGFNVNSLIASLGIGGLAISLALQNVLGDIFSSFSIAFDKPFEEGDFIVVGEHKGTVKHIGLKTTRITALQGEEIVISNTELTSSRIQNFKKMQQRRIVFEIGVEYSTSQENLKAIPEIIGTIITDHELTELERVHFVAFGESNLNFEIVYYMLTSDYAAYMDTQQDINLRILEEFGTRGIEMAYPTRTIHMINQK